MLNKHLKGIFFFTQKLLPLIVDVGPTVNVSSGLIRFALLGYNAYATMKSAIERLTKTKTKLGARRIAVNLVALSAFKPTLAVAR